MNVLHHGRSWDQGGPAVFLSAWWIEEHWGRGFEILTLEEDGFVAAHPDWRGHGVVLARRRPLEISADELERIDPGDPREVEALRHNIRQLHAESRKLQDAYIWLEREHATITDGWRGRKHSRREAAAFRTLRDRNPRSRIPVLRTNEPSFGSFPR